MTHFAPIIEQIEDATNRVITDYQTRSIGGGCINTAYLLDTGTASYFIKLNRPALIDMFEAEAIGLSEFSEMDCVKVPTVICSGATTEHSFLVLEHIQLGSLRGQASAVLGEQLANLHTHAKPYFGWHRDNTIGSTEQVNTREHNWIGFWQQHRLGKQLDIAARQGYRGRLQEQGQKLLEAIPLFFSNYNPDPVLLHGDLWGGNAATDDAGNPVIFDPATYYGDRETDIAMTELFGGFNSDFYHAYQSVYPLDIGYKTRKTLYNLYHIINHVNLFGSGYLGQAESMIGQLLAEV
jgi:fructosamine-3-kinase